MGFVTDALFGEAPSAPNAGATAAQQSKINKDAIYDSAAVNQIGQSGPGFDISYTGHIGRPDRKVNYQLTGDRAKLADLMNANALTTAGGMQNNPYSDTNLGIPVSAKHNRLQDVPQIGGGASGPNVGNPSSFEYERYGQPALNSREVNAGTVGGFNPGNNAERSQGVEDSMYAALRNRLDRTQGQTYDRTVNELTQRGLPIGQEAWGDEMGNLNIAFGDQDLNAARVAMEMGQAEDQRLFGQDLTTAQEGRAQVGQQFGQDVAASGQNFGQDLSRKNFAAQLNQQDYGQAINAAGFNLGADQQRFGQETTAGQFNLANQNQEFGQGVTREQLAAQINNQNFGQDFAIRGQNLQEAGASGGYDLNKLMAMINANPEATAQMPGQPAYQIAPADFMGATNANFTNATNQHNANMGGLASLGGAGMMAMAMCHPDFKEDKRDISSILPRIESLDIEAWKYKPGIGDGGVSGYHIGPYADQFKQVFGIGDGVTINMMDAIGICLAGLKEASQRFKLLADNYGIYI